MPFAIVEDLVMISCENLISNLYSAVRSHAVRLLLALFTVLALTGGSLCIDAYADTMPDVTLSQESAGPGSNGWLQREDGYWTYMKWGFLVKGKWENIGDRWYWFNAEGVMQTGWQSIDGAEYYLAESTTENHPMGSCYMNEVTPDNFIVNESGAKVGPAAPPVPTSATRPNPYGYSCVEVDITNQTVYCYINQDLVVVTPCVTGNAWAHPTSVGHFRINSKERNRYLQGYNSNGTRYKSWVNFWMPFNGGQGLHDAGWRSSFGGTIYQSGGSHGCVNMPYDAAAAIYNVSWVGMPVIVHK